MYRPDIGSFYEWHVAGVLSRHSNELAVDKTLLVFRVLGWGSVRFSVRRVHILISICLTIGEMLLITRSESFLIGVLSSSQCFQVAIHTFFSNRRELPSSEETHFQRRQRPSYKSRFRLLCEDQALFRASEEVHQWKTRGISVFLDTSDVLLIFVSLQPSQCVSHDAVNSADTKDTQGCAVTGCGAVDCARHEFRRPNSIGDLQKGER